ncbi:MAG: hypothetical protein Q9162_003198 [Coniocarpon cinnabarinum]
MTTENTPAELNDLFASPSQPLDSSLINELLSILRLHDLTPQELFYKWESYSIKLGGSERLTLNLQRARDLKRDIQDALERETRGKSHHARVERRAAGATPRVTGRGADAADMFGMMDGVVQTPLRSSVTTTGTTKRKSEFATPAHKVSKQSAESSPLDPKASIGSSKGSISFANRQHSGEIIETLNDTLAIPEPPSAPFTTSRIALKANSDLKKFAYKTMSMHLSSASEILDDRIDEFLNLVQDHHQIEDGAFGNPAMQSTAEIVAVGRIACDTPESSLKTGSVVLETSRRTGAGLRVPLQLDSVSQFELFPGKIVAVKGKNASGDTFTVSEFLSLPALKLPATPPNQLLDINTRLRGEESAESGPIQPLNILTAAGPYTSEQDLAYEPLNALIDRAISTSADALVLLGPFLDIEHPLVRTGQFSSIAGLDTDTTTLTDVFRALVALPLQRLAKQLPGLRIVMVPSVRDVISKHAAWPQDRLLRKELQLPKQCDMAPNPVMLSFNEVMIGLSCHDSLYDLRWEQLVGGTEKTKKDPLARLAGHLIEQRHFAPLYPPRGRDELVKPSIADALEEEGEVKATGAMLDVGYVALGDWYTCKPDVLLTPSLLNPFVKVVDGVTVVNPGSVMRKSNAGSFAHLYVHARQVSDEERVAGDLIPHAVYERTRIDVVKV